MTASKLVLTRDDLALADRIARARHVRNLRAGSRNDQIAPDAERVDLLGARGAVAFCRLANIDLGPHERAGVAKGGIVLSWHGQRLRVASAGCTRPSYVHHPSRGFDVDIVVVMECANHLTQSWRIAGWLDADIFRRFARTGNLGRGVTVVVANQFLRPARELWELKDASAPEQIEMALA